MLDRRLPHGVRVTLPLVLALLAAARRGRLRLQRRRPTLDRRRPGPRDARARRRRALRPGGRAAERRHEGGRRGRVRKVLRVAGPGRGAEQAARQERPAGHVVFSRDVEPWLGERVGGFLLMPAAERDEPDGAVALAIADRSASTTRWRAMRRNGDLRAGRKLPRRDATTVTARAEATYEAAVGDFFVDGTLAGLRAAIDVSKGGASLADRRPLHGRDRSASRAAHSHPSTPIRRRSPLACTRRPPRGATRAREIRRRADPVVASLTANADEIAIQATADKTLTGDLGGGSSAQVSVGQLPADSWLALATPPLGPLVKQALASAGVHDDGRRAGARRTSASTSTETCSTRSAASAVRARRSPLDIGGGVLLQLPTTPRRSGC